ncbi:5001_t:CDS:2 [Acaulospora morrowiae]|uniref:5001_t:CDS:1 n=1 Tax=Acaulospora morrowiae TaxID=94023 RepID=A0A9N9FKE4_9GLOM|nr:5001_t:CDS:2 [Acaulospora morrowiae]
MEKKINTLWNWWKDMEEINTEENEILLTVYKTINEEVVARQSRLEKQIEHMGRILIELLKNKQLTIIKKKQ